MIATLWKIIRRIFLTRNELLAFIIQSWLMTIFFWTSILVSFLWKTGSFINKGVFYFFCYPPQLTTDYLFYTSAKTYHQRYSTLLLLLLLFPPFLIFLTSCYHVLSSSSGQHNLLLQSPQQVWLGATFRAPRFTTSGAPWFVTHSWFHFLIIQFSFLQPLDLFMFKTKHLLIKFVIPFT